MRGEILYLYKRKLITQLCLYMRNSKGNLRNIQSMENRDSSTFKVKVGESATSKESLGTHELPFFYTPPQP